MMTNPSVESVKKFGKTPKDTGSVEVQVAVLTGRIKHLTGHFETNKKDHSSMRGLMRLIGLRRSLLKYLSKKDEGRYLKLIKELEIRK